MILFYQGPCARITHEVFEARCPQPQSYLIDELRQVHAVRHKAHRVVAKLTPVRVCSTALAGASAIVAAASWSAFERPTTSLVALGVMATSIAVLAISRGRRAYELRATYRGRVVCLFRSTDRLTFGQVNRALRRVLESRAEMRRGART